MVEGGLGLALMISPVLCRKPSSEEIAVPQEPSVPRTPQEQPARQGEEAMRKQAQSLAVDL